MGDWTLFSNHGHVLVCLACNRDARLRDVAVDVGITERAVQKIVRELQLAGFISITKHGRCNRYEINSRKALRHELEAQCTVGRLMQLFLKPARPARAATEADKPEPAEQQAPAPTPKSRKTLDNPETKTVPGQTAAADKARKPEKKPGPVTGAQDTREGETEKAGAPDARQQGTLF